MKAFNTIKFIILSLLLVIAENAIAQYSGEYDYNEDDYDGNYEYNNYNNNSYQRYSEDEYRRRQERFYKKSYEEEDLYNGGYRRKNYSSSENYYGFGGINMGGINSKSNPRFGDDNITKPKEPRNNDLDNREVGVIDGIDKLGQDGKGGISNSTNPGEGRGELDPKGDKKTEDAPPPPDEPDIPIDTAVPLLISGGLMLARFKLKKTKNALV
jgi:hypothetical protein